MKVQIITVGKKHDAGIAGAINEYTKRLDRVMSIEWECVSPSGYDETKARREESDAILARLKPADTVWLLDERGKQLTSPALASNINVLQYQGIQRLVVIIGGAYGVGDELRSKAHFVWSLSELVFPHQLVRLMLVEQLYRASEINRGSGYHHA